MSARQFWRMGMAASLVVVGGMLIRRGRAEGARPAATTLPSEAMVVRQGTLGIELDIDGVFVPRDAFELRVRTKQYHDEFAIKKSIEPGTKVSKGDVLLELETDKIDRAIGAAGNEATIADANLAKTEADVALGQKGEALAMSGVKNELDNRQANLKRWDAIGGEIFRLEGSLKARLSDFEVDNDADELDQLHKMYKSEDLTSVTADIVVKRAQRTLELQKLSAKVAHAEADKTAEVDAPIERQKRQEAVNQQLQVVAELEAAQTQARALRDTTLVGARAAAEEAHRKLAELKSDREMFSVVSPVDGVVVYGAFDHQAWQGMERRQLAAGEKVPGEQVLMTVYEPKKLKLETEFPERDLAMWLAGAKVKVTPRARVDVTYEGTARAVSMVGDAKGPQQAFEVVIDLPEVSEQLAPGFTADVSFDEGKYVFGLLVPNTAISKNKIWVIKRGQKPEEAEIRNVIIGPSDGETTVIKSGLQEGEIVLKQGRPSSN